MATRLLFTPEMAFQLGEFAPGAKANFYTSGTTALVTVYADEGYTTPHDAPLVADGAGVFPAVWFDGGGSVKAVITAADDSAIATIDSVPKVSTSSSDASAISKNPTSENPSTNVEDAIDFLSEKSTFIPTDDQRTDGADFFCGFPTDPTQPVEPVAIVPLVSEATYNALEAGDILYHDGASFIRLPKGSYGETLGINAAGNAPEFSAPAKLIVHDQKTSGTDGGTFTTGAWRTRDLNTVAVDDLTGASLASNQITLPAGTYDFNITAPALRVNGHQARLYNVTDSSVVAMGTTERTDIENAVIATRSQVLTRATFSAETVLEVQHRCAVTFNTFGFGISAGVGAEIYTTAEITKIG